MRQEFFNTWLDLDELWDQSGFRRGFSIVTAGVDLSYLIKLNTCEDKGHSITLMIDLRKAFDTVNHNIWVYCLAIRELFL